MPRLLPLLALVTLAASGCVTTASSSGTSSDRALVGRWDMERITDGRTDVTAEANPAGDRFITLHADGTFESGGQPYGRNTGRWTLDPAYNELILESDLGDADDSYWIVTLDGDEMEWAGVRSETARRFRILSRRATR